MLEAARLMRRYRFERTIKIIFFTGEEQGLLGSQAYVEQHYGTFEDPINDVYFVDLVVDARCGENWDEAH